MSNRHLLALREAGIAGTIPADPGVRHVLMILADYADASGKAWPTVKTLAAQMGCDVRTVRRHITAAVADGLLTADRRGGKGKASTYRLTLPGHPRPPLDGDTRTPMSPLRVVPNAQTRTSTSANPDTHVPPITGSTSSQRRKGSIGSRDSYGGSDDYGRGSRSKNGPKNRPDYGALRDRRMRLSAGRRRVLDEIAGRQGAQYTADFIAGYTGSRDDLIGDLMAAETSLKTERLARADADEAEWQATKDAEWTAAAGSPIARAMAAGWDQSTPIHDGRHGGSCYVCAAAEPIPTGER